MAKQTIVQGDTFGEAWGRQNTMNTEIYAGPDYTGAYNDAYATVASHATTSAIWAAAGNVINFTGAETITDFPAADQAGSQRTLICAGATVFTHAGNITVQGGANYTASANEVVTVRALSTTTFHVMPPGGGAETGANSDITSMTGLDNDGIPLAKVANAASDGANNDITSMTGLSDDGIPLAKVATAAGSGANSDITSMTGLDDDGIPLAKVADAASDGANSDITSMTGLDNDGIPLLKVANAASDGANSDITSLTGLTSAGALPSLTPVTDSAANFAANFTGANLYGGTFICNVTGTCQLPLMVAGMNFTIITLGAIEVIVDTNANDGYLMDGTTNAEGKNLTNLSTAGDIAVFQYYTADDWLITTNGWTPEV